MTAGTAPDLEFTPATAADMPFITAAIQRLDMDTERLAAEQFITLRQDGSIIAFGRVKPYQHVNELGSVVVLEEHRGKGLGARVTRELIQRFPDDEVYLTTDIPQFYVPLGFLETTIVPPELAHKLEHVHASGQRERAVCMIYDRRIEQLPAIADTYRAKHVLEGYLQRTPLVHGPYLSRTLGFDAHLKLENLQPIGAFKVRGGIYSAATLDEEQRSRGIIGASTGNHGQSLAYGAHLLGVRCVIAMPVESNPMKVEAMRALGAEVEFHGANFEEARLWAEDHAAREGLRYVHHINSPDLITGVSTLALEVVEDLPDVDTVIVPVGGGSGAIGQCLVAKALRPGVEVIGVQTAGAPAVYNSWRDRVLQQAPIETGAEGLATGFAYYIAVKTFVDHMDDMVLVSEAEIRDAVLLLLRGAHVVAEESGAAATAAAVQLKDRLQGKKVAIIVTGGNMTPEHLRTLLTP